jgi:hypothetical protein
MGEVVEMVPKMKLNVLERLILQNLLPKEGSFLNLKLLRVVKEELSFDEAENKALQFRQDTGENPMLRWTPDVCPDKEFTFGAVVRGIIVKALTDLDKAEKITQDHYSLYEKFMENNEPE